MNGVYTVDELAYGCSDFGEHVDKIIDQVNLGCLVKYEDVELIYAGSSMYRHHINHKKVMQSILDNDDGSINSHLSSLSIHTPPSRKFMELVDEKTQELAEEAARSYKGEYDV